jgi:hypothetical protein
MGLMRVQDSPALGQCPVESYFQYVEEPSD